MVLSDFCLRKRIGIHFPQEEIRSFFKYISKKNLNDLHFGYDKKQIINLFKLQDELAKHSIYVWFHFKYIHAVKVYIYGKRKSPHTGNIIHTNFIFYYSKSNLNKIIQEFHKIPDSDFSPRMGASANDQEDILELTLSNGQSFSVSLPRN